MASNVVTRDALLMQAQRRGPVPASEGTQVEISRAIAQVQGALIVAQQRPRDQIAAAERMREACAVQSLADRAFFRYSRGGGQITGPSIHLATELARCWGNVDYGITELRRDEGRGESEMLAYAWDLETNAKVANSFIVPHKRDKKGGAEALTDMRDIYENNANNAARRLRECIFRILPTSFIEEAKTICDTTLQNGGGEPIEKRRDALLKAFGDLGISRARLERKIGRAADKLTAHDIGVLRVVYQSIRRGEVTIADEFPDDAADRATAELTSRALTARPAAPRRQDEDAAQPDAGPASDEPDLSAWRIDLPRRKDGAPDFVTWRNDFLGLLGEAGDEDAIERLVQANLDVYDEMEAVDAKGLAALREKIGEARRRVAGPAGK